MNKPMKHYLLIIICIAIRFHATAQQVDADITKLSDHPRILLLAGEEQAIKKAIAQQDVWQKVHNAILQECEAIISLPRIERIQIGRRLLDKSRECLRRVFYLSYAARITGDQKYVLRAENELLAVSNFSDWNPNHFLDVAEMTMGVAIGYDWLYDQLSVTSRKLISDAIVTKGLLPSLEPRYSGFLKAKHNWNQVCNAGMVYGALAVAEEYPEISQQIISRSLQTIPLAMEEYGPSGAYPEGYGYWSYGTSFNVMFLSAVEKAFDSDFGLSSIPGFLNTSGFLQHMTGSTGLAFNWGDSGLRGHLNPAMFWFAKRSGDASVLWIEKDYLNSKDLTPITNNRLLPALLIWGKEIQLDKVTAPSHKVWMGQGVNPVCLMRTSWTDPNAIYLGFKAGSASVNHGHMDIGSFIMESDGVRWAADLGMQEYESLESKGIQIFGRTQDAQRWSILRTNNFVHNTLTVDGQLQQVNGYAKIDKHSDHPVFTFAVSDLSSVYENQMAKVIRGVGIKDEAYVVIQDEVTVLDKTTTMKWTMLTAADVNITGKNTATLVKDGKKLFVRVDSPSNVTLKTWSSQPTTSYDAPNPGTVMIGFEVNLRAHEKQQFTVLLIPAKALKKSKTKITPLADW